MTGTYRRLVPGTKYRWTYCENTEDWCCGGSGIFTGNDEEGNPTFLTDDPEEPVGGWHRHDPPTHVELVEE